MRGVSCGRARRWEATRSHPSSVHSTHAQNQDSTAARRPGSRTWSQQVTEVTERERREPGLGVGRTEAQRQAGGRCQSRGGAPWPHDARGGQLRLKGPRGGRSRPWPLYPLQQDEGQLSSLAQETCQGPPPGKARICLADTARPWGAVPPLGPAPPSGTRSASPCPGSALLGGQTLLTIPRVPQAPHTQTRRRCPANTSLQTRHSLGLAHDPTCPPRAAPGTEGQPLLPECLPTPPAVRSGASLREQRDTARTCLPHWGPPGFLALRPETLRTVADAC